MDRRTQVTYLLCLLQEETERLLSDEGSGLEQLSAEEIVNIALGIVVSNQYNNKSKKYQSPIASVNKDEAFAQMEDGTFQPLFGVDHDHES